MATPILNQVSKDLAYKLQDPVTSGTIDGKRLTAANRLGYIIRAYRRLLRIVTLLYPSLVNKLFQSYYLTMEGVATSASGTITTSSVPFLEVFELYLKESGDSSYFKATHVFPEEYESIVTGQNKFFTPNLTNHKYYWSVIGGEIKTLPASIHTASITYRPDISTALRTSGYDGATDLDTPADYLDILLSYACIEGYMDLGQADMVNVYRTDVAEQLNVLNFAKKEESIEDSEKEI